MIKVEEEEYTGNYPIVNLVINLFNLACLVLIIIFLVPYTAICLTKDKLRVCFKYEDSKAILP